MPDSSLIVLSGVFPGLAGWLYRLRTVVIDSLDVVPVAGRGSYFGLFF